MEQNQPASGFPREAAWRGAMTPNQVREFEAWIAAHPGERAVWEEEVALTRLLARLPDAAAPSNLTARVLDAIDREVPQPQTTLISSWLGWLSRLGWVPRLAGVALLVVVGYLGHHQYRSSQRGELARSVAEVSTLVGAVPSVEVLQDFTVIRNLESAAVPDEELLALLQ